MARTFWSQSLPRNTAIKKNIRHSLSTPSIDQLHVVRVPTAPGSGNVPVRPSNEERNGNAQGALHVCEMSCYQSISLGISMACLGEKQRLAVWPDPVWNTSCPPSRI